MSDEGPLHGFQIVVFLWYPYIAEKERDLVCLLLFFLFSILFFRAVLGSEQN